MTLENVAVVFIKHCFSLTYAFTDTYSAIRWKTKPKKKKNQKQK